jgi:putative hemolysin
MDMEAPVLPVHISGRNSSMFYGLALIKKEIGTFLLSREIFAGKNKEIKLTCGDPIPYNAFGKSLTKDHYAKLLKKHLYDIGSGRRGIFKTEKTIIHPVDKQVIKRELMMSADIGKTKDGKSIYMVRYDSAKNVLREISRVREHTYRKVGEGTGKKADTDKYDRYYDHIVLWDDNDLEIVGSYRIGVTRDIIRKYGTQKLYNSGLYTLNSSFNPYIEQAVELGRSFVQPKYWGSSALDYLWQGIGAYLREVENTRYLFGAVSISDKYPDEAKAIIIEYYKKWYSGDDTMVSPVNEVTLPQSYIDSAKNILSGKDYEEDYRNMKTALRNFSLTVPVLLRKYSDVCHYGGVKYLSYTINTGFNNAVDCFVLVDTWQMKPEFKSRYMTLQKSLNRRSTGIENAVEKNIKTIL